MRKCVVPIVMVIILTGIAHLAFTDETVPFPYWNHNDHIYTFFSFVNVHNLEPVTVTVNFQGSDGSLLLGKTASIPPGGSWQPATYDTWYTGGDGPGYGSFVLETAGQGSEYDTVYIWGAVFSVLADSSPGFTLILTGNPYGGKYAPPTPDPMATPTPPVVPASGPMGLGLILAIFTCLIGMGSLRRR